MLEVRESMLFMLRKSIKKGESSDRIASFILSLLKIIAKNNQIIWAKSRGRR